MTPLEMLQDPQFSEFLEALRLAGRLGAGVGLSQHDMNVVFTVVRFHDECDSNGGNEDLAAAVMGYSQAQAVRRVLQTDVRMRGVDPLSLVQLLCRPNPKSERDIVQATGWSLRSVRALLREAESRGLVVPAPRRARS